MADRGGSRTKLDISTSVQMRIELRVPPQLLPVSRERNTKRNGRGGNTKFTDVYQVMAESRKKTPTFKFRQLNFAFCFRAFLPRSYHFLRLVPPNRFAVIPLLSGLFRGDHGLPYSALQLTMSRKPIRIKLRALCISQNFSSGLIVLGFPEFSRNPNAFEIFRIPVQTQWSGPVMASGSET